MIRALLALAVSSSVFAHVATMPIRHAVESIALVF